MSPQGRKAANAIYQAIENACKSLSPSDYVEVLEDAQEYLETSLDAARADEKRKGKE